MHHWIAFRLPTASLRRCDLRRTSPRGVAVATLELGRVRSPPSNSSLLFSPRTPKSALQHFAAVLSSTRRSPPSNSSLPFSPHTPKFALQQFAAVLSSTRRSPPSN